MAAVTTMPFYFRHFYDNATFSAQATLITSTVTFLNQTYGALFSATFNNAGSPSVDNISGLANCATDIETCCSHVQGCGYNTEHHKDIGRIASALEGWRGRNYGSDLYRGYIVVLWTDYEPYVYCEYFYNPNTVSYVHRVVGSLAEVFNFNRAIHILNIDDYTPSLRIAHMSILLAHETAHTLGASDQYGEEFHEYDDKWECMLDYFYSEDSAALFFYNAVKLNPEKAFCDVCKASIESGIDFALDDYNYALDMLEP